MTAAGAISQATTRTEEEEEEDSGAVDSSRSGDSDGDASLGNKGSSQPAKGRCRAGGMITKQRGEGGSEEAGIARGAIVL